MREVTHLYLSSVRERREFLKRELRKKDIDYEVQEFLQSGYEGENIIVTGFLKGKKPIIVITAHYDGFGAYDNAGGVIALLWLIRWAKKDRVSSLKFDILPVFLDGEERGLLGAKHFIKNVSLKNKFYAHISLDGFGIGSSIGGFANLKKVRLKVNSIEKEISLGADTIVFQESNIPSFHLFTLPENELYYLKKDHIFPKTWRIIHTKKDTPEKIEEYFIPFLSLSLYKAISNLDFKKRGIVIIKGENDGF